MHPPYEGGYRRSRRGICGDGPERAGGDWGGLAETWVDITKSAPEKGRIVNPWYHPHWRIAHLRARYRALPPGSSPGPPGRNCCPIPQPARTYRRLSGCGGAFPHHRCYGRFTWVNYNKSTMLVKRGCRDDFCPVGRCANWVIPSFPAFGQPHPTARMRQSPPWRWRAARAQP